jgi:hypothetical protein
VTDIILWAAFSAQTIFILALLGASRKQLNDSVEKNGMFASVAGYIISAALILSPSVAFFYLLINR